MRKLVVMLLLMLVSASLAHPAAAQSASQCFPETGQCVGGRFQQYWNANGGLPVFGFPIGDQRTMQGSEGAFSTQWFERERFEAHPENQPPYDVLLGRLGDEALRRQGRDWFTFPKGQPQNSCQFFPETQHTVCEPFLSYWRAHGLEFDRRAGKSYAESLALFGLPLSEPAMETNSSGFTVLTQWFERARFEYLPNNPDPYKVLLGRLGAELFDPAAVSGATQYHAVQQPGWPHPLEVPVGFTIEEVASGLTSPRFMARDPLDGSLVYGAMTANQVVRLRDTNSDGRYDQQQVVADGLTFVHSVAFVSGQLYAAAEDRVVRLGNFDANGRAQSVETILPLPQGARDLYNHRTRTLVQGPDGKLYLSVGSPCDACEDSNPQRAALLRFNTDGSNLEIYASGLRNTVGFDWRPFTNELWGADMGRNNLGQNKVADELNRIEQGRTYGWPYCYDNNVPNPEFNDPSRCASATPPVFNFPPHWAPLGFTFYRGGTFPPSYQGDALVAFHGTARDQVQDLGGYNVVRVRFKDDQPVSMEDLVHGWNASGDTWGRPAGLLEMPDGSLLISDDASGRIYRLQYVG
jgi:glucose/arabinose dehydrogenase